MARLRNVTTGCIIAENVEKADSLWRRLAGFIPYGQVRPSDGLWFDNCSLIHTIGMRARLDVIFLDKDNRVMYVRQSVPAWRIAVGCAGAYAVVELGHDGLDGRDLLSGDKLVLE